MKDWNKKFKDFWLPLITTEGKLDMKKIKNELHDWDFVMKQVPLVYDHVAGLSKVMYDAQTIIDEHDSRCHEFCVDKDDHKIELDDCRKSTLKEIESQNLAGQEVKKVRIKNMILKELREKIERIKEDKNVLSQGGLRPTYMAGFENYRKKVLSLIDTMVEEGKV